MGFISHQLPGMLGPCGDGGEQPGQGWGAGMFSARPGEGRNLETGHRAPTQPEGGTIPSPIHVSLALVPGKQKNISESGH